MADDPLWKDAFMQRLTRMVERDKAHPCIIGWSLGNESGYGTTHDAMAAWVRARDPSRVLFYEPASYGTRAVCNGVNGANAVGLNVAVGIGGSGIGVGVGAASVVPKATDVLCPMYARVGDCIKLANMFPDMPLVLCEYAHMMGEKCTFSCTFVVSSCLSFIHRTCLSCCSS